MSCEKNEALRFVSGRARILKTVSVNEEPRPEKTRADINAAEVALEKAKQVAYESGATYEDVSIVQRIGRRVSEKLQDGVITLNNNSPLRR